MSVLKQVNRLGLPRLSVELLDEPPATTPSGAGEFVGEMSVLNGDGLRMAALVSTSTPRREPAPRTIRSPTWYTVTEHPPPTWRSVPARRAEYAFSRPAPDGHCC